MMDRWSSSNVRLKLSYFHVVMKNTLLLFSRRDGDMHKHKMWYGLVRII